MSICILNDSSGQIGGGWTFLRNFKVGLKDIIVDNPEDADVLFIPSASMVKRDTVMSWVRDKKIVLRCDNYLKHSRNRRTGMSRMLDYAKVADVVVYQSQWAKSFLELYNHSDGKSTVIPNGSERMVVEPYEYDGRKRYLYVAANSDESKGWVMAQQKFMEIHRKEKAELWIVGSFNSKLVEYGFDFFNDEKINYFGTVDYKEMAKIYTSCDAFLYSYFCDVCPNALNEALIYGLDIVDCYGMLETGGAPELCKTGGRTSEQMCYDYRELIKGL